MFRYTSTLPPDYLEELEGLMFFNPGQDTVFAGIVDSIETFGRPTVAVDGERVRVRVERLEEVQTLFALDNDALVGVLVYSRDTPERLTIIHTAVNHDYSSQGRFAQSLLVMRMLALLRSSARRIKGIESIRVLYGGSQIRDLRV